MTAATPEELDRYSAMLATPSERSSAVSNVALRWVAEMGYGSQRIGRRGVQWVAAEVAIAVRRAPGDA